MIWITNHDIKGRSDKLRDPLSEEIDEITTHADDPEGCPAIVNGPGPWTGVDIDASYDDIQDGFETALGSQIVFGDEVESSPES